MCHKSILSTVSAISRGLCVPLYCNVNEQSMNDFLSALVSSAHFHCHIANKKDSPALLSVCVTISPTRIPLFFLRCSSPILRNNSAAVLRFVYASLIFCVSVCDFGILMNDQRRQVWLAHHLAALLLLPNSILFGVVRCIRMTNNSFRHLELAQQRTARPNNKSQI